jgi:U3 small nucleolar RNA-associated protein 14
MPPLAHPAADNLMYCIPDSKEVSFSENYIDVLDVFDGRADSSVEEEASIGDMPARSKTAAVMEDEDAEEEEQDSSILSADEDVNSNALEGLEKLVSSLEPSNKRKGDSPNATLPRKKRALEERTTAGVEGEFTTITPGTSNAIHPTRCA